MHKSILDIPREEVKNENPGDTNINYISQMLRIMCSCGLAYGTEMIPID